MAARPEPKKPHLILTPDSRLRVFISSTLKELAEEREVVRQSILKLRLQPVLFEAGARPHPARELYQAYLSQSHVFIGIYWQSYGWVGPGMEISGLEDEYNLSAALPRLIYIKSPAPDREPGLTRMLKRLQQEDTASYKHFSTSAELGELVANDLALLLSESYEAASRPSSEAELVPGPLTNVPFPRNPLLGRARELETVCRWLSHDHMALVTLTGAGGAGKSRLAIEVALQLRNQFPDGVYLVRLTSVSDADRVLPAIAETLGLWEAAQGRPVQEILTNYLRDRRVLLVLDNFEQVLSGALKVAELLEACPQLKVLATSRAPLRLRGEQELLIQPLPVPSLNEPAEPARLSQYASVDLFIQRAQGVRPDFQVTNENAPAVAEICCRLDGLPLAIELAAARIRLLSPHELLSRLSRRFDVLRGGTRDLPERQQTLRGAIDWSYNLLQEPARTVFRRLSVFAGGFSLEAAEAVCSPGDAAGSVLEQIEALVDFSLLNAAEGLEDHERFGMLESIREYAFERLTESGEAEAAQKLLAEYLLTWSRQVEPRIRTAERARWRAILEQDFDNIRATLQWACANRAGLETGQRLMIALTYVWALCGAMTEGRRYGEAFVALCDDQTPPGIRAGLLTVTGTIALLQAGARTDLPDVGNLVEIARQSGEQPTLATALLLGGAWALSSGDPARAARYFEECQPLFHELGDEWSEVLATLWLGNAASLLGDSERSRSLFERALGMARHQGDPWLLVVPLVDAAQEAFMKGDLDKAEATMLEVESMLRAARDAWTLGWPLTVLAQIRLSHRDLAAARSYLLEALQTGDTYGNMMAVIFALIETACIITVRCSAPAAEPSQWDLDLMDAARLCGAAEQFVDYPILLGSVITRDMYDALLKQARAAIPPEIWEPGLREGRGMPFERARDIARAELNRVAAG